MNEQGVQDWLSRLKVAWESGDGVGALKLFAHVERYYERPFYAATKPDEVAAYWKDIDSLTDIRFDYELIALSTENVAVVHWQNWYRVTPDSELDHLDGVFFITFNSGGECTEFRQWWFQEPQVN